MTVTDTVINNKYQLWLEANEESAAGKARGRGRRTRGKSNRRHPKGIMDNLENEFPREAIPNYLKIFIYTKSFLLTGKARQRPEKTPGRPRHFSSSEKLRENPSMTPAAVMLNSVSPCHLMVPTSKEN